MNVRSVFGSTKFKKRSGRFGIEGREKTDTRDKKALCRRKKYSTSMYKTTAIKRVPYLHDRVKFNARIRSCKNLYHKGK